MPTFILASLVAASLQALLTGPTSRPSSWGFQVRSPSSSPPPTSGS